MTPTEAHRISRAAGGLPMWVVYCRPKDFPSAYVARMHVIGGGGHYATKMHVIGMTVDEVRELLPPGLYNLGRNPEDDAKIVEVWI